MLLSSYCVPDTVQDVEVRKRLFSYLQIAYVPVAETDWWNRQLSEKYTQPRQHTSFIKTYPNQESRIKDPYLWIQRTHYSRCLWGEEVAGRNEDKGTNE